MPARARGRVVLTQVNGHRESQLSLLAMQITSSCNRGRHWGQILETLFVLLEAVTLAAGFGLLGVYIGVRYY
jgi:hypothetical protein